MADRVKEERAAAVSGYELVHIKRVEDGGVGACITLRDGSLVLASLVFGLQYNNTEDLFSSKIFFLTSIPTKKKNQPQGALCYLVTISAVCVCNRRKSIHGANRYFMVLS